MGSSRDSSVLRSLAVAFGDGLAFGVGMKLSQNAARQPGAPRPADLGPVAERIGLLEERFDRMEHAVTALPAAAPAGQGSTPFDHKVLEAVVNALDARLKEQAGQLDRRLAELEAKIAIELKSLDRQDHAIVSSLEPRLDEVRRESHDQIAALEGALNAVRAELDARAAAMEKSIEANLQELVETAVDERVPGAVSAQLQPLDQQLREEIREATGRATGLLATAAEAAIEEKLAAMRDESARKDREIAELRARLADSDHAMLDVLGAIGQMCRQAAGRLESGGEPAAPAPPPPEAPAAVIEIPDAAPPNDDATLAMAEPETPAMECAPAEAALEIVADPAPLVAVPGFAEPKKESRLWRIPLVSSFFIFATGGLVALHYLRL